MGYHVLYQTPGVRMLGGMDPVDYYQFHFCIIYDFMFILCSFYARLFSRNVFFK